MHKIAILLAVIGYVSSARLDNLQYLPPQGSSQQQGPKSGSPGGQYQPSGPSFDSHNQSPSAGPQGPAGQHGTAGPQQQYPQGPGGQPSNQYGAPSGPSGAQGSQQFGAPSGPGAQGSGQQYPTQRSPLADVPILRLDSENPGDGTYRYAYETGNDIAAEEEGSAQSGWNKAQGSYRFVSPEGQNFEITYTADENGYVPQGAHLPTSPPIPEAILKSLEVIRQAEAAGNIIEGAYQPEGDDGQYHEGHDEGQYNAQQPSGGYQQPAGGYQQEITKSGPQGSQAAPQGFTHQNDGQQRYPGQQGAGQQQPTAPNGGYRY